MVARRGWKVVGYIVGGLLLLSASCLALMRLDVTIDAYATRDEALRHFVFREHFTGVLPADATDFEVGQSLDSGGASCRFRFTSTQWLEGLTPATAPINTFNMLWSSPWPGQPTGDSTRLLDPQALPPNVRLFCVNGAALAVNVESHVAACWRPSRVCVDQRD